MAELLIDRMLPRYDIAVTHAGVFRVPPERCLRALRDLDVMRHPVVRALVAARGLPNRGERLRTLRIDDLAGPRMGWLLLGEEPGTEVVLGQVAQPWRAAGSEAPRVTAEEFAAFDRPGFAKIAASLHADPYGTSSSVLTVETRVALTDPESLRRFRRYWRVVGPFSGLIRRLALRMLADELRQRPDIEGEIRIEQPVEVVFDMATDPRKEPRYNPLIRAAEQITPGPVGAGTRFRAEAAARGRTVPMEIELTEYEPPHRVASSIRVTGTDIRGGMTFEPADGATVMRWAWQVRPHGPLRLATPLLHRMGRRQERRIWTGLKRYLESGAATGRG
ncbi:MAG TPA: SRPBCC family protein [Pseudonocardia sp.]|nr:SRPBCC family protein [Pseudonocardia sp.]